LVLFKTLKCKGCVNRDRIRVVNTTVSTY